MRDTARTLAFVAALCVGGAGCASCPESVRTALRTPTSGQAVAARRAYTLACPDQFRLLFTDQPDLIATLEVDADGTANFGNLGRIRVEGMTASDVEQGIAKLLRIPAEQVRIEVSEFASRHLLMFGPADGVQRVISYQGPETATELLRRTGGVAEGTAFNAVYVVRPHVAAGRRPEVFPIDLNAIVMGNDPRTDVRLEPYDQIYLGETAAASVGRVLPPWLKNMIPGLNSVD